MRSTISPADSFPAPEGSIVRPEMFNAFMEANGLWDCAFEKLGTIDFSSGARAFRHFSSKA